MQMKSMFLGVCGAVLLAGAALADSAITITDPYVRTSGPTAKVGAAFMVIESTGAADRLVGAKSDVAKKTEIHTHMENAEGVMSMVHLEDGIAIEADTPHALKRGGDHVMLMGLNTGLSDGDIVTLTLEFETAGEVVIDVVVDTKR